jgi:hypothetical protein
VSSREPSAQPQGVPDADAHGCPVGTDWPHGVDGTDSLIADLVRLKEVIAAEPDDLPGPPAAGRRSDQVRSNG